MPSLVTLVNTTTLYDQDDASIAMAENGVFVVSWTSMYQDGSQYGVYGQQYDANGAKSGSEFRVNTTTGANQFYSSVAMRGDLLFTVAWSGNGSGDNLGVFARSFRRTGQAAVQVNLRAQNQAGTVHSPAAASLTEQQLRSIVKQAVSFWGRSPLTNSQRATLGRVSFQVSDLSDRVLGQATLEQIHVDSNAAGYGWFIDTTPADDVEFDWVRTDSERLARDSSDAYGRIDLLTVVMHEMGHVLGKDHVADADGLMSNQLPLGTRRLA